jgi:hypothetical protein
VPGARRLKPAPSPSATKCDKRDTMNPAEGTHGALERAVPFML